MRQSEAMFGWIMAGPAIILIVGFLIIPFLLAFVFAFTNQRLISPNPTEYVGARNFARLLTVRTLTVEPERDEAGSQFLTKTGATPTHVCATSPATTPITPISKGYRNGLAFP